MELVDTGSPEEIIAGLRAELADLNVTFDMCWEADQRAIKRWQVETGRTRVWPDRAEMVLFLISRLEEAEAALEPFAAFAEKAGRFVQGRADFGGSPIMPTKHFRLADFQRARDILERRTVSAQKQPSSTETNVNE